MEIKPEIKAVKGAGFTMDYLRFGSGRRPLVIIPGVNICSVLLSAEAVAASYGMFAQSHTVYLFDRKRDVEPGYLVPEMARDTAAAMALLGLTDADVFGASQGGMIAQLIAAQQPQLVHRLLLGSTLARQNEVSIPVFERWMALAKAGDGVALNRDMAEKVYSPAYRQQYQAAFAEQEKQGTPEELRRFAVLAEGCRRFDCFELLPRITCPTLVIGSMEDHTLSGEASREIAERLGCGLYLYDGYSHAVYDEAPDYRQRQQAFFCEEE